jgi:transglutaminase-like putative cysteine protease
VQSADSELQVQWWQPLRKAGVIFVLALPVMFFMFVVMPRLPPLWKMPLQAQHAKTGMSDSMSPGDIASLAQSADLVFRATFPDGVPNRHELYWYGLILDHFDGVRWTESCRDCSGEWQSADELPAQNIAGKLYQVILEPHGNQWAYVLFPSALHDADMQINQDGIVRYGGDVYERKIYEARYVKPIILEQPILKNKKRYLALPDKVNPQSLALAQQWRTETDNRQAIVQKALDFYHQSFSYTLQPPLLGEQRIDDFLFGTRSGFCEHFASSFVFLMRAAGIPARVVVGYMGGEIHAQDKYVVVRQYDAHAWAEVWLPDAGWVSVDPTAAVAPERIDLGFFDAFSNDENFSGDVGLAAFRQIALLNKLRLQFDRIDYLWARWVLGYEGSQQQQLLEKLGLFSPLRIAMWGGGGVIVMFISLCLYLYWREWWSAHEPPATRSYRQLCHAYARCGIERLVTETPLQYAEKIAVANYSGADVFLLLSQQYYASLYIGDRLQDAEPAPNFFAVSRRLYCQLFFNWFVSKKMGFKL